jgi:hypothetical protein
VLIINIRPELTVLTEMNGKPWLPFIKKWSKNANYSNKRGLFTSSIWISYVIVHFVNAINF